MLLYDKSLRRSLAQCIGCICYSLLISWLSSCYAHFFIYCTLIHLQCSVTFKSRDYPHFILVSRRLLTWKLFCKTLSNSISCFRFVWTLLITTFILRKKQFYHLRYNSLLHPQNSSLQSCICISEVKISSNTP